MALRNQEVASLQMELTAVREELGQRESESFEYRELLGHCEMELTLCKQDFQTSQQSLAQRTAEVEQLRISLDESRQKLDQRLIELAANRELLELRESNLMLCGTELIACKQTISRREKEIAEFRALNFPERCATLEEQLQAISRRTQKFERHLEGMGRERMAFRTAVQAEIDSLRAAV